MYDRRAPYLVWLRSCHLSGRFITKIFHPNVSSAGEICVNTLKKDWKSSYGIGHILVTIKCLLIYPNPDSALDEEAGKLLQENYESYCERAKLITSVHATPKVCISRDAISYRSPKTADLSFIFHQVPPPEFAAQSTQNEVPDAPAPIVASLPSASALPSLSQPPVVSPQKGTNTIATVTIPLQQSASNTLTVSSSLPSLAKGGAGKETDRHVSPAPLGTSDSNVAPVIKVGAMVSPAKAVKRGAAPGVTAGEKRKKALKRL
jgi:ubiquitin-conjugating enzyme E2 S